MMFDRFPLNEVHQEDALSFVRSLRPESVDCTFTDPAYESLEKHRAIGTTTRLAKSDSSSNEWFGVFRDKEVFDLASAMWKAHKPRTFAYVMVDPASEPHYRYAFTLAGWWWWSSWSWQKVSANRYEKNRDQIIAHMDSGDFAEAFQLMAAMGMGYHGRRSHERILMFERRNLRQEQGRDMPTGRSGALLDKAMVDVLAVPVVKGYPTEKPLALVERVLRATVETGAVVLDPFAGSGTTAAAAKALGCGFLTCDVSETAVRLTRARVGPAP